MMLSVILLSMQVILLSILNVIWHLICGNNLNWFLNLNLIYETLWTGARIALFNIGKTQLVSFEWSNNTGSIDVKVEGSVLEKKSFNIVKLTFSFKLDQCSYIISIAKTASKKIRAITSLLKSHYIKENVFLR